MRAIIDNFDHISRLTIKGGVDIGLVPGGVGLNRLRWTGSALVDLADLTTIHVRRFNGCWWFHATEIKETIMRVVPGMENDPVPETEEVEIIHTQPVAMTWAERKRIIDDAGTLRILDPTEWAAKIAEDAADISDNQGLKAQLTDLIRNTSFADLETKVNNIFADHTPAQRTFLLQLSRVVLYLAKKELK